jgi:hypothetical protein
VTSAPDPTLISAIVAFAVLPSTAQAADWVIGDVFANAPDGPTALKVFDNNGVFKEEFGSPGLSGEGTGLRLRCQPRPLCDVLPDERDAQVLHFIGMSDPDVDEFVRKYDPAGTSSTATPTWRPKGGRLDRPRRRPTD